MVDERERSSNFRLSCWWVRLFGIQSGRLRFQIADQITRVIVSDAQSRHEDARVLCHESQCSRIFLRSQPVGIHDEFREPRALTARGDAAQVRARTVADANGVARRAHLLEQDLARLCAELIAGIAGRAGWRRTNLVAPLRNLATDIHDEPLDVDALPIFSAHSPLASLPSRTSWRCSVRSTLR